jgi:ankyrin repeat protein
MLFQPSTAFLLKHFTTSPFHALHKAVLSNDLPFIHSLLSSGYDIDDLDNDFGTPLHTAIWSNQPSAFELLFIRGADLNMLDEGSGERPGDPPIRLAVRLGRLAMVKRLWDEGVEVDKYAQRCQSPPGAQ